MRAILIAAAVALVLAGGGVAAYLATKDDDSGSAGEQLLGQAPPSTAPTQTTPTETSPSEQTETSTSSSATATSPTETTAPAAPPPPPPPEHARPPRGAAGADRRRHADQGHPAAARLLRSPGAQVLRDRQREPRNRERECDVGPALAGQGPLRGALRTPGLLGRRADEIGAARDPAVQLRPCPRDRARRVDDLGQPAEVIST